MFGRRVASCLFLTVLTPAQDGELTWATFERLHRELRPAADAPWRRIPWKIDLLAAQREATTARKPLFLWAMDGHPLGCT